MINKNAILLPAFAGCLLSLAACGSKQPGEDAVATVNGYEITLAELNSELSEQGVQNPEDPVVRKAALQAIINRKLLLGLAEERELDRTPEFILREQRMRDQMLAEAAIRYLAPNAGTPDEAAVAAFVENAQASGQRTMYQVEALRLTSRPRPEIMRAIESASSLAQIQQIIRKENLAAQSGAMTWDSAVLPADLTRQLNALPAREPFVIAEQNGVLAGVILNKASQPLNPSETRKMAQAMIGQQSMRKKIGTWLEEQRSSAEIEYADDYDPAAPVEGTGSDAGAQAPAPQPQPAGQT